MKRRTQANEGRPLLLATAVAGALGVLLLSATAAPAAATFSSASSSAASTLSSASAWQPQPQKQQLLDAASSASLAAANATAHKLELLVESLGKLAPPWLREAVGGKVQRAKQKVASSLQPQPPTSSSGSSLSSSASSVPAALPYDAPAPDSWLAADPCHAVPNPCASTPPFAFLEVRPARASAAEGGGRLPAPAHLAPLTPTAPWSRVSGPGGVGPNPYWVTGEAATSVPGLAPGFQADPSASMVLTVAAESALGQDTGRAEESAATVRSPGRGRVEAEAVRGAVAGNITTTTATTSSSSSTSKNRASPSESVRRRRRLSMARRMKLLADGGGAEGRNSNRRSLSDAATAAAAAAAAASAPSPLPPPRASWAGALSESSPRLEGGSRYSATPFVVDTDGADYRFQVSSAGDWSPSLALYRGGGGGAFSPSAAKNDNKPTVIPSSSGPTRGKANSAVLSLVGQPLRRGEVYTLVVSASSPSPSPSSSDENNKAGNETGAFVALAAGPGGVYPNEVSIPPRWKLSSSTAAAAASGKKKDEEGSSSSSPVTTKKGVFKRPAAGDEEASASGAVVAFDAVPFVVAASARGIEWKVAAGESASSPGSKSWSPWAAVYDFDLFEAALAAAAAAESASKSEPVTAGLVAASVAGKGETTVTLRGLSLEGEGKRYALVVAGKTASDGGEFSAEVFGPEAVKGWVPPTAAPPKTTPAPRVVEASSPSPSPSSSSSSLPSSSPSSSSSSSSSADTLPRLLEPTSVDPPPPPPIQFREYGIQHHGGPIMTGVPTLNYVWYSTPKFQPTTREILEDLGRGLGESSWYRVQSSYSTKSGGAMTQALRFGDDSPTVDEGDPCWSGRALTDTSVAAVVTCLIKAGRLAYSSNSITLVLTGSDVAEGSDATGSFCSNFCGWHSYSNDHLGRPFKFGFIGSAARCPSACAGQSNASPNANIEADAMASIIAHEVTEAATDPELSAWFDGDGKENADKCAWTYGTVWNVGGGGGGKGKNKKDASSPSSSSSSSSIPGAGGVANAKVGGRDFLLQLNWANKATQGYCDNK